MNWFKYVNPMENNRLTKKLSEAKIIGKRRRADLELYKPTDSQHRKGKK